NRGKIAEIKEIFALPQVRLLTFEDHPFSDVVEEGNSFEENALLKARQISAETGLPVLAEDSGLEVLALDGQPGIHSSRFAHEHATDEENIAKLLELLQGVGDRQARVRTVAVLRFPEGEELLTEGELRGEIALEPRGKSGFGYDPVFIPEAFAKTLAELGPEIKNRISHRRRALEKLLKLLHERL
ncbi:MAG: RdgB/HAM1 family non-canonical purine NTP pyrophosphatase, partial [Candidatus Bipolaricaulia bacterium]